MAPASICINTQTPLVQFLRPLDGLGAGRDPRATVDLARLQEGIDYRYSPGGVTRMVYPLLRRLLRSRTLSDVHWVSLNPHGPRTVRLGPLTLHQVAVEPDRLGGYGETKEAIWGRLHELEGPDRHDDLFWSEAFSEYAYYNRRTAERMRELDGAHDFDAFYVHDFQQMPVGKMLGTLKPKIFRWHIPFDGAAVPEAWRPVLVDYLRSYDTIVVSAERYATSLASLAPDRPVVRLYPYIDPSDYSRPGPAAVRAVCRRFGIAADDEVVLLVGRMDPIKGQDLAVDALAALAPEYPRLRLVLVGNGSFSGSSAGLGLSKGARWRAHLEERVRAAHLESRVVFTGHVGQDDLDSLYERCRFTLLPSVREGFGLVAVESWIHGKPAIVTRSAGIAELVEDGKNGLLFDPGEPATLARAMRRLLDDRTGRLRARLARAGRRTALRCSIGEAVRGERALLRRLAGV